MSEIEKLYKNAGIEKCNRNLKPCPFDKQCVGCEFNWYPDFTAEKQLELIKWLGRKDYGDFTSSLLINTNDDGKTCFSAGVKATYCSLEVLYDSSRKPNFEEALAALINDLWYDLTPEEQAEIKEILCE